MSKNTGSPLNLDLYEGSDDIVTALTDLQNSNMRKLNNASPNIRDWAPNTRYSEGDMVQDPYVAGVTLVAVKDHVSGNSTTRTQFGTSERANWRGMQGYPNISYNTTSNAGLSTGDSFLDGDGTLKRALTNQTSGALNYGGIANLSSKASVYQPGQYYTRGDVVLVPGLNETRADLGRIRYGLFMCVQAHTATPYFPASNLKRWALLNGESAYFLSQSVEMFWGLPGCFTRIGSTVRIDVLSDVHKYIISSSYGWVEGVPKITLPDYFAATAASAGTKATPGPYLRLATNGIDHTLVFQIVGNQIFRWASNAETAANSWVHGDVTYLTDRPYYWEGNYVTNPDPSTVF